MDYEYQIWQDGMMVAAGCGSDLEAVRRDMLHYAFVYGQDGPVEIRGNVSTSDKSTADIASKL